MSAAERPLYYRLEGHTPVPCDLFAYGRTQEDIDARTVGRTRLGHFEVSTVFLGIDHAFGCGPPLLFETMIFDTSNGGWAAAFDDYQERYGTWEEAAAGHARAVAHVSAQHANRITEGST